MGKAVFVIDRILLVFLLLIFLLLTINVIVFDEAGYQTLTPRSLTSIILITTGLLLVAVLLVGLFRSELIPNHYNVKFQYASVAIFFILSVILIASIHQAKIYYGDVDIIMDIVNHQFHIGEPYSLVSRYLQVFPFQSFFVIVLQLLKKLFNNNFDIIFMLLNAGVLTWALNSLIELTKMIVGKKNAKFIYLTTVMLLLFSPLYLFVPIVYGDAIGIGLSIVAILYFVRFINQYKKNNNLSQVNLLISSFLFIISVLIKGSMIVVVVGLIIFGVMYLINFHRLIPVLVAIAIFISTNVIGTMVSHSYNNNPDDNPLMLKNIATPNLCWIAMGLQSSRYDYRENNIDQVTSDKNLEKVSEIGTYNAFSLASSFITSNEEVIRNSQQQRDLAEESIGKSVNAFIKNPGYMINFFRAKIIFMWADTSFTTSAWETNPYGDYGHLTDYVNLDNKNKGNVLVNALSNPQSMLRKTTNILNLVITFLLYLFSLVFVVYVLVKKKELNLIERLLLIIFLVGFVVYLFWEVKSRYAMPFLLVLFPFSIKGLINLSFNNVKKQSSDLRKESN